MAAADPLAGAAPGPGAGVGPAGGPLDHMLLLVATFDPAEEIAP